MEYYSLFSEASFYGNYIESNEINTGSMNTDTLKLSSNTNQIILGPNQSTIINVNCDSNRIINFPTTTSDADVVLTDSDQTINGQKTFSETIHVHDISPELNLTYSIGNYLNYFISVYSKTIYISEIRTSDDNNITVFNNLILDKLTAGQLLKLDADKKIINDPNVYVILSDLLTMLDDYVLKNSPVINYGTVNQLLRTDGSGLVYTSNTLPDACSANNFTITNPSIKFSSNNYVLMTNGSGYAYTSNTLPDISVGNVLPTFTSNNLGSLTYRWNYIYVKYGDFYSIDSGNILPSLGLTYDLGSSGKLWNNVYADTINTNILNVNVSVGSNLIPDVDLTRSLGSSSYRWNQLFTKNLTDNNNTVSIFGANDNNKLNIYYKDPSNNDATFINIRTSQGGRIAIVGDPSQNKFNISDGTYNIFNVNSAQNGRITIAGANTQGKLNILDVDSNSVFNINTGNNGRITVGGLGTANKFNIYDGDGNLLVGTNTSSGSTNLSIQGPNYQYKFQVFDGSGARVFNINTNNTIINSISINPWTTSTYNLGTNSLKWNNVYANNLYGSWSPSGDLIPSANNTYDLGSSSYVWKTINATNLLVSTYTQVKQLLATQLIYIDRSSETGVTTSLDMRAGTAAGATTANRTEIAMSIKGGGGGNLYASIELKLLNGAYPLVLGSSGGDVSFSNNITPTVDNTYSCGKSGYRWSFIWTGYGVLQTSDGNDKENIQECELGLDFVNDLKPKKYNWIGKSQDEVNYGIVAQDLESTLEKHNCCNFSGLHKPVDDGDKYGINYSQFIPILIKSIQELTAEVNQLKEKIIKLES